MEIVRDRQVPTWKTPRLFVQSFQQDPLLSFLRGRWCSFRWEKVCISTWSANANYFSFCEGPNYTKICVLIDQYRTQENSNGLICPELPFCESISLRCNSFTSSPLIRGNPAWGAHFYFLCIIGGKKGSENLHSLPLGLPSFVCSGKRDFTFLN